MASRGVALSFEAVRDWAQKFGGMYAKRLKRRAGRAGDCWYLDEVYLAINGNLQYLWRAVDQDGEVLDILVQPRRNKQAAKKFFRKLLNKHPYGPRLIITDKLRSYTAAKGRDTPDCQTHTGQRQKQSCGEFASANTGTRAAHARIQVCRTCPAIPGKFRYHFIFLQSRPPFTGGEELS